ncbi:hypothetical protein AB4156_44270, partial [Cupriavidus sp. 2MCAB6]|uniref:hypothetical protein n=1 Tax=Cupriavidus sp. 2MCAB6 TaxID=3232981 RepID=UPI003F93E82F
MPQSQAEALTQPDSESWAARASRLYRQHLDLILVGIALAGLIAGGWFWWSGMANSASLAWTVATLPVLLALFIQIVRSLRRGDVGLDIVAALSMSAALA